MWTKSGRFGGSRAAHVFDVSQTEGRKLPEMSEKPTGSVGDYRER